MTNKKLIVICGPTSTGKTLLAIKLAKKFNGEIISADSRQVYEGMDIGTGKEWGDGVKIWGYDLVSPKKEFSVSHYLSIVSKTIDDIVRREKTPILVGGTGLYIKAVVDGIRTAGVPRNNKLRENLEGKSIASLYETLSQTDPIKAGSLNFSDKKNPRRLIRAIEVAQYQLTKKTLPINNTIANKFDTLFIGLTAPKTFLEQRIDKRVKDRVDQGVKKEVKGLLKNGVGWDKPAMMAMGYGLWRDYFEGLPAGKQGEVDESQVMDEWSREEKRYAKRQMVWFKKDLRINWFDITEREYAKNVENLVKKWYKDTEYAKKS